MAATIDNEDDGDMNQALESQRSIQDGVEGDSTLDSEGCQTAGQAVLGSAAASKVQRLRQGLGKGDALFHNQYQMVRLTYQSKLRQASPID
uniref:Uncharacterized protein n=1 Tax=Macrostomum lignano TaxID=282301 RepID=A0A1I8FKB2_9PLAT